MNSRGLTLMELMVALTITGLALSVGYAGVSSIADGRARIDETVTQVARELGIRHSLADWIGGARALADEDGSRTNRGFGDQDADVSGEPASVFEAPQFRGLDGVYRTVDDDELWFLTASSTPLGRGEFVVRLFVDRDESTPAKGLVATMAEWRGARVAQVPIDSSVWGLDIHYHTSVLGRNRRLPSWVSSTVLPAAVEVRLTGAAGDSLAPLLALPLLVTVPGGA